MSEEGIVAIVVATIGALGAIGSAGAVVAAQVAKRLEKRLGEPNGHGNLHEAVSGIAHKVEELTASQQHLVSGMSSMISGQGRQDENLAAIHKRLQAGDERMVVLGGRISEQGDELAGLAERVEAIELSCDYIARHVPADDEERPDDLTP
jgi:hypothetical protein